MAEKIVTEETGTIGRQRVLPWRIALEISLRNIKIRFWRSLITSGGIVLAIAFFMSVMTHKAICETLLEKGSEIVQVEVKNSMGEDMQVKQIWLIVLSLLVCTVGIVNAMLMSVTERYREIGTMKCLGALDNFIIRIFLLESVLQGTIASILGSLVGSLIMIISDRFRYGGETFSLMPLGKVSVFIGLSITVGMILSTLAAIYPAYVASRMQPVEALRTEV